MSTPHNIVFAQDRTATAPVVRQLDRLLRSTPGLNWAALVDGAFDYGSAGPLPYAAHGINCFDDPAFDGLEQAAPWLVPMHAGSDGLSLLTVLIRHCSGRPMLSFIASPMTARALQAAWKRLHWTADEDGARLLMRFADTRTLPTLPKLLTAQQWGVYTASLSTWLIVNREGMLEEIPLAAGQAASQDSIVISHAQMGKLLEHAEPDAIIDLIVETMPDIIPAGLEGSRLFTIVQETCVMARRLGVEAFSDVVSLVVAAFLTEGNSNRNADMLALLQSKAWNDGDLGAVLVSEGMV